MAKEININTLLAELVGTIIFITIVIRSADFGALQPYVVASGLLASVLFMGNNLQINPAITFMQWMKDNIPTDVAISNALAQILGAAIAIYVAAIKA